MSKKLQFLPWLCLLALLCMGYIPALTDFNVNQFGTTATGVSIKSGVVITNGVNWGSAFSSRSGSAGGEQFGAGATATGTSGLAVGNAANANGPGSGTAIGTAASAAQLNSVAVGTGANAGDAEDTAIGVSSRVLNGSQFSTALGYAATASASHQIVLGTVSEEVIAPSLTFKTLINADINSGLASIANGVGVLTNDGNGNFSWTTTVGGSGAFQLWGTNATSGAITNANGGGVSIGLNGTPFQISGSGAGVVSGGSNEAGLYLYSDPNNTNGIFVSPQDDAIISNAIGSVTMVNGSLTTSGTITNKSLLSASSVATDANGKLIAGSGISGITTQTNGTQLATGQTTLNINAGANVTVTGSSSGGASTINIAASSGTTQGGVQTNSVLQATNIVGIHDSICVPASSMFSVNPIAPVTVATYTVVTNDTLGWAFAHGATNEARVRLSFPYDWDGNAVQVQLSAVCTGTNSSSATNTVFAVAAAAIKPWQDLSSPGFGTAIWVTNHINVNAWAEGWAWLPLTVGNSPSATNSILFQIQRLGGQAGDTLTNTSLVLTEMRLFFTRNLTTTNAPVNSP